MRYRAFVPYSILGTGLWASAHILIGYFVSRSIDSAAEYAGRGAFLLATLIVVVVGVVFLVRHFRVEENRRAAVRWMERPLRRRAGSSSSARRFRPQLRFLWDRVTPGGTFGLEFTSLMAILAVASFVLVAYTVDRQRRRRADPGRHDRDRRRRTACRPAGSTTWPRSSPTSARSRSSCRWRCRRGRSSPPAAAGPSSACWSPGMAMIFVGVHELKAAVDRPRPGGRPGRRRRAPPSPAATPPTRPSTSGWR